jgi:hypothetical protein
MKMMSWQTITCLSTKGRKSEDGDNPLMRLITEHSLRDEPKLVMGNESSTQKKRNMHKGSGIRLVRPEQNGKKNVCHRGVRVWKCSNHDEPWHRS